MREVGSLCLAALLWGVAVALAAAGAIALGERYLGQGLEALAVEALSQALLRYVPSALFGAAVALLLTRVTGLRVLPRTAVPIAVCAAALVDPRVAVSLPRIWVLAAFLAAGSLWLLLLWRRPGAEDGGRRAIAAAVALLAFALAVVAADRLLLRQASSAERPNILLVVLDTLRADRLSAFGYARPTTPRLEQLARESVRFTDFQSTSSWTLPSHASLFTGLYPARHGATQEHQWLARRFATLAEVLRNDGYATYAVVGNPWAGTLPQLDQGFGSVEERWRSGEGYRERDPRTPHGINTAVHELLRTAPRERPFFLFLNYVDVHAPHTPGEPYRSRFLRRAVSPERAARLAARRWPEHYAGRPYTEEELSILSDLYDGEVAQLDADVGALLDLLREDGRYDDTWIVVTSDHGEHFGENDRISHVFTLYGTAVRVPLIVRPAGGGVPGGRVDARPGQLVDLVPTLLAAAGLSPSAMPHQGRDLFAAEAEPAPRLAEYYWPRQEFGVFSPAELQAAAPVVSGFERRLRSIEENGLRLIWSSDGRHELYDLREDPGETLDLFGRPEHRPAAERLVARLESRLVELGAPADARPAEPTRARPRDEETLEALRALGYAR